MIGLVIVSHSAKLAEGVVELARGMVGASVPLAAAGGLEDAYGVLGTDALRVMNAIESVYSADGVLVLMDLGSAILSAEMALDLLAPDMHEHVKLCAAPLVEGTVAAAVQAKLGFPLDQVIAAAHKALAGKSAQLGEAPVQHAPMSEPQPNKLTQRLQLTMPNRLGLHARPAAKLVDLLSRFSAAVQIRNLTNGRGAVDTHSFNGLMLLGAVGGHQLEFSANGRDAANALSAIQVFAAQNFGDPVDESTPSLSPQPQRLSTPLKSRLQGQPASTGIAVGTAKIFRAQLLPIPTHPATDPSIELDALTAAIAATKAEIKSHSASPASDIFAAHVAFLNDHEVLNPVRSLINDQHLNVAVAWKQVMDALIDQYRQQATEYLRARAADVESLQAQVLAHLLGSTLTHPTLTEPAILIARDLTPVDTSALDPQFILGIATAEGSATAHSAIIARSLGIPAIVGLGESILAVSDGTPLILDGASGEVFVSPNATLSETYTAQAAADQADQQRAHELSNQLAYTADGRRVEIFANIGSVSDAQQAIERGAEGVGLLRSEFIFLNRTTAPSEDEQYAAYRAIAQTLNGRPLIIRTLDVGGDKPLPYIEQKPEANPFLGLRGIRLCLARPELFMPQLRAIARLAVDFRVQVMFPMIATIEEFRAAKALLIEAGGASIPTGIMVEIPAAVESIEQFAAEVDFFSIGTNDLTQYTFAAERGNADVAHLANSSHPAILSMIRRVVETAHAHHRPVAVCGEMASDPTAVPILVNLGVDELSMSPSAIPAIKVLVRGLHTEKETP